MKATLLLSVCLSISYVITAQEEIPKKANTISINDTISALNYFGKITETLLENGYGILNSDQKNGIITTTEKPFKNGSVKLNFLIRENKVMLRGDYKDNLSIDLGGVTSGPSWSEIRFIGQRNSIALNAWEELHKIALQIPGTKQYLIK
jgi:hypothetical protein